MVIEPRAIGRNELWGLFMHSGLFPTIMERLGFGLESHILELCDDLKLWGKFLGQ